MENSSQDNNTFKQEQFEAVVTKKETDKNLEVEILEGSLTGKKATIETFNLSPVNAIEYTVGEKVIVSPVNIAGRETFYIVDYSRSTSLYLLFFVFAALVVLMARRKGMASLIGLAFSFLIIFQFVLPQILAGQNPIFIAILASLIITPVNFYLSHGVNKKTTIAICGTIISLILTGFLATIFVEISKLTGTASEEATYLQLIKGAAINLKGLLLAGIIIGLLGILDDITISQAAIVHQLKEVSPKISFGELYSRAMDVGRDHIASLVNTLVLVYTGATMPLLLLFINNPLPFSKVINQQIVAEEIVRTIIASIGLILAVPITTLIASYMISKNKK